MKKTIWKWIMLITICLPLIKATAETKNNIYYTNDNGVQMTEQEYNRMITLYSERKAAILTQEEFDKVKVGTIVDTNVTYEKVVTDENGIISTEKISEEEYNNAKILKNCSNRTKSGDYGYHETSYKRLSATLLDYGNNNFTLISILTWKKVPTTRSYDVFAFRLAHMSYNDVSGSQNYYTSSGSFNISYNSSSAGYKGLSNGAGISMNLVDGSDITGYDLSLSADLAISEWNYSTAHVYVTYQHAQSDLTRTQSKSYTLSAGGLGGVLYYSDTNIRNKYDWMAGLELQTYM